MGSGGGGWHPIRDTWEKVKETGRKVKEFFFGSSERAGRSTGLEESYDPEKARMEETLRINKILTDFRIEIESKSDDIEKNAVKLSRKSLDEFIDYLKKINEKNYGGKKLNINIERLIRENRKTEDEIYGYVKKHIQRRVSLDDAECLNILKMEKGKAKEKAMTNFSTKILKGAIGELSEKVKNNMEEQGENVFFQMQNRMDIVQNSTMESSAKFKEIEKLKIQDEDGLETEKSKIIYRMALCEKALMLAEVKR